MGTHRPPPRGKRERRSINPPQLVLVSLRIRRGVSGALTGAVLWVGACKRFGVTAVPSHPIRSDRLA